jgi:hypothetical protein
MANLPLGGNQPPLRLVRDNEATHRRPTRHRPRETDLETLVQEELSAEVVALSDAILALLRNHDYVEASAVTEDLTLETTEMLLFAAMNCARHIVGAAAPARPGQRPAGATGLRRLK